MDAAAMFDDAAVAAPAAGEAVAPAALPLAGARTRSRSRDRLRQELRQLRATASAAKAAITVLNDTAERIRRDAAMTHIDTRDLQTSAAEIEAIKGNIEGLWHHAEGVARTLQELHNHLE